MKHNLVAPVGTPITFGDLVKTLHYRLKSESRTAPLAKKIQDFTASQYCYFLNSGRASQSLILTAMRRISSSERDEVILPAYTCYSVAAATVRAGLKIRLVDIDPASLDFNLERLGNVDSHRVLAALGCNLFGVLNNWDRLNEIGRAGGYFLIDDGAQSFGASYKGRASGTLGAAGFYSLGRGKVLTTYNGGILVTNHKELAGHLDEIVSDLPTASFIDESIVYVKLMVYSMFIRPSLYWIPASLPFLGLGETTYEDDFHMSRLSKVQLIAGSVIYDSILNFNTLRAANAMELANGVLNIGNFEIPGWNPADCPPYLRLPVLAPDRAARDRAVKELRSVGIVATKMYPSTLRAIPGIEASLVSSDTNFPGAQQLVDRLFTLPTHPYLTKQDVDKILAGLRRI